MLGSFRQVRAVFFILKSAALRLALVLAMAGVIPASEAAMAELISDVSRGVFSPGRPESQSMRRFARARIAATGTSPKHHRIRNAVRRNLRTGLFQFAGHQPVHP